MYIIIYGNPGDGFNYRGPFDTMEEAVNYAETHDDYDETWWVSSVEPPEEKPTIIVSEILSEEYSPKD